MEQEAKSFRVQTSSVISMQFKEFSTQKANVHFSPLSSVKFQKCLQFVLRSDIKFSCKMKYFKLTNIFL